MSKLQTPAKVTRHQIDDQSSPFIVSNKTQLSQKKFYDNGYSLSNRKTLNSSNPSAMVSPKQGRLINNSNSGNISSSYTTPRNKDQHHAKQINSAKQKSQLKPYQGKQNRLHNETPSKDSEQGKIKKIENQANELVNIKVSKGKKSGKNDANDRNAKATIEIWNGIQNEKPSDQPAVANISFKDSDVADEFEYKFDPSYLSGKKRCLSPQVRMEVHSIEPKRNNGKKYSQTPNTKRREREHQTPSFNINNFDSDDDIIHKTCMIITSQRGPIRRKKNFIKRMEFDISKRDDRDKTFDQLKDNILIRQTSPNKERSKSSKRVQSNSPMKESEMQSETYQPPGDYEIQEVPKKKLKKEEYEQIYNRMMQYEERKKQAIKLLQDQKRRDEELEQLTGVHSRKINTNQQKHCYNRLAEDAERRKITQIKHHQQQLLLQEEQMKTLFKPKINSNFSSSRKEQSSLRVSKQNFIGSTALNLEQKLEIFQNEAKYQSRGSVGGRSTPPMAN